MPPAICLGSRNHFAPIIRSQQFLAVLINVYGHLKKTSFLKNPTSLSASFGKICLSIPTARRRRYPPNRRRDLSQRRDAVATLSRDAVVTLPGNGGTPSLPPRGTPSLLPLPHAHFPHEDCCVPPSCVYTICHTRVSAAQHQLIGDTPPCFLKFSKLFSFFPSFLSFMHKKPP